MKAAFKIILTIIISFNLLGIAAPPKRCTMPCCQHRRDEGQPVCGHCAPFQVKSPETPPCCQVNAAKDPVPATINTAQAERPLPASASISGPAFAVNTIHRRIPHGTGAPPGASAAVPIYKSTSSYLC